MVKDQHQQFVKSPPHIDYSHHLVHHDHKVIAKLNYPSRPFSKRIVTFHNFHYLKSLTYSISMSHSKSFQVMLNPLDLAICERLTLIGLGLLNVL
jgi:hypothetical protein